ncbi:TBC domain-containing protein [Trichoderma gamsii]|uniref:TBC domain-containing protein n=2 Tax=Trichoderma gamsii TaxID=398673 RepID=A0A2P4Z817_9HYPO|nr:TBC domain-containing protein [Trichoderma gamsii]PON20435.1 TBC domain-containing protein [Trichoderma gamsii]
MALASIRSRSTSRSRRSADPNIIGLRYEKTIQAEPPIPLPPRNPSRSTIRTLSIRSSASSPSPSVYENLSLYSPSLVVVAPPTEEHPALRTPVRQAKLNHESWKRDSGHAPTPTSATTIFEEDCEEEGEERKEERNAQKADNTSPGANHSPPRSTNIDAPVDFDAVPPHSVPQSQHGTVVGPVPGGWQSSRGETVVIRPAASAPSPSLKKLHTASVAQQPSTPSPLPSPASPTGKRQSFLQRLSVCSSAPAKGKLGLAVGEGSPTANANAPPMQPLMRGSQPPPAPAHKQPQRSSPGNAETSSLALRARVRAHATASLPNAASPAHEDACFAPLGVSIPTDSLLEDDFMATLSFSNRGSIMFGGRRAGPLGLDGASDAARGDALRSDAFPSAPSTPTHARSGSASASIDRLESYAGANASNPALRAPLPPPPDIRVLTSEIEKESQKVRSLYGVGDAINWEDGARHSYCEPLEPTPELPAEEDGNDSILPPPIPVWGTPRSVRSASSSVHFDYRRDTELAGGLEDWEDIDGASVDRYGFISAPRPRSRLGTPTEMKSAQFSPRRRLQKRELTGLSPLGPSRKMSARSLNTQNSEMSTASKRSSRSVIRQASNLLPHNRDRRWLDEAGDMLTLPPSLQDAAEEAQIERISETLKRKEWERSEKWRKMAKVVRKGGQGEGMEFEFDKKNPKLIERTWKGIPDRWRAAAWWSFLSSSAMDHESYASEEDIVSSFHHLLEQSSPDDVQIDLDVPRTISRHIMFRKRYRGGQRLLFRVLHCLSIYFPETGYVQGMASLAATLLCYFDEEKCFVMLVRLWQLRGLDRLYRPGFEGLMKALHEFDETWLNKDVAKRLTELSVDITAYGTRWYLTLFNLSIPFPAQLRVWDVFLLLGDSAAEPAISIGSSDSETTPPTGLDILHATSAALVQALREVLLDSDFENAMKALTSWIPIKDEDLLMKVAKAEWKSHQGKKKT